MELQYLHSQFNRLRPFSGHLRTTSPFNSYLNGSSNIETIDATLTTRNEILEFLLENLSKAQDNMKLQADIHRRHHEFNTRDLVYLKLQPYRQQSAVQWPTHKLSLRYFGPFQIIKKITPVIYEL